MSCGSRILRGLMPKSPSWSGLFGFKGVEGKTGYFRRMLKWRFLGVITTLPSRASHPMAHSKMGPFPSTSFLSCASESSPWVLRTYQMAPAIWPMSSSTVTPILIMLSQLSPDDCEWRREKKESGLSPLRLSSAVRAGAGDRSCEVADFAWDLRRKGARERAFMRTDFGLYGDEESGLPRPPLVC